MEIKISCKSIAKRRNTITSITYEYCKPVRTVREFLTETVRINMEQYQKRQESSEILKVLGKEEIEDQAQTGKIGFERTDGERKPDFKKAVETALSSFEDGIVAVFVDGYKLEDLGEELDLHEGSEVTFVRMTMLAGRMW